MIHNITRNNSNNSEYNNIIIIIGVDPVCAAAAQSYFDATLAGDSDEAASEKAATAYLRYILSPLHKIFLVLR